MGLVDDRAAGWLQSLAGNLLRSSAATVANCLDHASNWSAIAFAAVLGVGPAGHVAAFIRGTIRKRTTSSVLMSMQGRASIGMPWSSLMTSIRDASLSPMASVNVSGLFGVAG